MNADETQRRESTLHGKVYLYTFGTRRCNVLSIFEQIHDLEMDILVRQQDIVVLAGFGFFSEKAIMVLNTEPLPW